MLPSTAVHRDRECAQYQGQRVTWTCGITLNIMMVATIWVTRVVGSVVLPRESDNRVPTQLPTLTAACRLIRTPQGALAHVQQIVTFRVEESVTMVVQQWSSFMYRPTPEESSRA